MNIKITDDYLKNNIIPCIKNTIIDNKLKINNLSSLNELEIIRIKLLGKKGFFSEKIKILRICNNKQKSIIGYYINQGKQEISLALQNQKTIIVNQKIKTQLNNEILDISLPGRQLIKGGLHPISIIITKIEAYFKKIGFNIITGPEIEEEYYNFDALNIPVNHPSRNYQDTFWLNKKKLLRTQTSSIQIRSMLIHNKPPIRIISSGPAYRNDYDQTHTPMFHQTEGFVVDNNITFSNLKEILYNFIQYFFKKKTKIRFRPSYFPFTEPSAEIDIINKNQKWIEILGCGMIHPNVLYNVGICSKKYSGFAFGIGIERLAMLYYGITDLRLFFENDIRFLKQFN